MEDLDLLKKELAQLEQRMVQDVERNSSIFQYIHRKQLQSSRNLFAYLSLRNQDIRHLQDQLHNFGLSSLASSENHIHRQLQEVQMRLGRKYHAKDLNKLTYQQSRSKLQHKNMVLFGNKQNLNIPYLMVTFDSSFAENYKIVEHLLKNGMNVARINCAHDEESVWMQMINNVKRAELATGLSCKIYMDLAGPKIRTSIRSGGGKKNKVPVQENGVIFMAEDDAPYHESQTVIGCTLKGIINQLNINDRVLIDDGLIETVVIKKHPDKVTLAVKRVSSKKPYIKEQKGINFPDTMLNIPALTEYDKECMSFIVPNADIVGYSFVNCAKDVEELQTILQSYSRSPHIILKIETPDAVKNLPELLLQGMQDEVFGVMIARGDLAVEIGFERMSEIQEEILWICESAHVPVVWATQVLENLNKTGVATRSEVTDAAHSAQAEGVMINKGDYILEVIDTLKDILHRTGGHHVKKRFTFRPLRIATRFMQKQLPELLIPE